MLSAEILVRRDIGGRDRCVRGWFIVLEAVFVSTILASSDASCFAFFACASADNAVLVYTLRHVRSVIVQSNPRHVASIDERLHRDRAPKSVENVDQAVRCRVAYTLEVVHQEHLGSRLSWMKLGLEHMMCNVGDLVSATGLQDVSLLSIIPTCHRPRAASHQQGKFQHKDWNIPLPQKSRSGLPRPIRCYPVIRPQVS